MTSRNPYGARNPERTQKLAESVAQALSPPRRTRAMKESRPSAWLEQQLLHSVEVLANRYRETKGGDASVTQARASAKETPKPPLADPDVAAEMMEVFGCLDLDGQNLVSVQDILAAARVLRHVQITEEMIANLVFNSEAAMGRNSSPSGVDFAMFAHMCMSSREKKGGGKKITRKEEKVSPLSHYNSPPSTAHLSNLVGKVYVLLSGQGRRRALHQVMRQEKLHPTPTQTTPGPPSSRGPGSRYLQQQLGDEGSTSSPRDTSSPRKRATSNSNNNNNNNNNNSLDGIITSPPPPISSAFSPSNLPPGVAKSPRASPVRSRSPPPSVGQVSDENRNSNGSNNAARSKDIAAGFLIGGGGGGAVPNWTPRTVSTNNSSANGQSGINKAALGRYFGDEKSETILEASPMRAVGAAGGRGNGMLSPGRGTMDVSVPNPVMMLTKDDY